MPPRKRAPAKAAPVEVPEDLGIRPNGLPRKRPIGKGADSSVARWRAAGEPIGHNRQRMIDASVYSSGPDLPPGKPIPWLPKPEEVPPKPTEEPQAEWPGLGHMRSGHAEWQLYSELHPDAKALVEAGEPHVLSRVWVERWVPPDDRRCKSRSVGKLSPWAGNQCSSRAIKGGRVCTTHGGNLATVKKAAQNALATAALPAAEKLIHIALKKQNVSDADRIKALIQILDRAGVEGRSTVSIEIAPWQKVLESAYATETGGATITGEEIEGVDFILEEDDDDDSGEWEGD